jgi:chromate transporter
MPTLWRSVSSCQVRPAAKWVQRWDSSAGASRVPIAAWLGFTLPSAVALVLFGLGVARFGNVVDSGWLHGLKIVAVAIVAQALWGMGRSLCPDRKRATFAVAAACILTAIPTTVGQVCAIVVGGALGLILLRDAAQLPHVGVDAKLSRRTGAISIAVFLILLLALPILSADTHPGLQLFARFYRAGALVFGGGHVVLPLLQSQVIPTGMTTNDVFLAGYGAAQAVPGLLFTLSAYLGTVSAIPPNGLLGAAIGLVAIFLPGTLLIIGVMPFWEALRRHQAMQAATKGINAVVVGILLAAFYNPVWTSAIRRPADFAVALAAFLALVFWRIPPWVVVVASAAAGTLLSLVPGG